MTTHREFLNSFISSYGPNNAKDVAWMLSTLRKGYLIYLLYHRRHTDLSSVREIINHLPKKIIAVNVRVQIRKEVFDRPTFRLKDPNNMKFIASYLDIVKKKYQGTTMLQDFLRIIKQENC
ncbi:hypothetical protein ACFL1Y_00935 [Patescibacteria group bacterium]